MLFQNKYRIESARLKGYDYSAIGSYFITICTRDRTPYFGSVQNGQMTLSEMGHIADNIWKTIPNHFTFTELDEFVIMP